MSKLTYINSVNKHLVRDKAFNLYRSYYNNNKIIGLAGPDIDNYIRTLYKYQFDSIIIYEYEKRMLLSQLPILLDFNISYNFNDINSISIDNNCFYDLDYCCTLNSVNTNLLTELDNYLLTIAIRGVGLLPTLKSYFNNFNEFQLNVLKTQKELSIIKKGYLYTIYYYRDTQPMLTILKLKTK